MPVAYQPGQRVVHPEFGEGVVVRIAGNGTVQAFFPSGERQVFAETLRPAVSRSDRIIAHVEAGLERLRGAWLHVEAHALPLMDNAAPRRASTCCPIRWCSPTKSQPRRHDVF